jgi:hypothetical protein
VRRQALPGELPATLEEWTAMAGITSATTLIEKHSVRGSVHASLSVARSSRQSMPFNSRRLSRNLWLNMMAAWAVDRRRAKIIVPLASLGCL